MLKLIVSNPGLALESQPQPLSPPIDQASFSSEVRLKGPNVYVMTVQDPSHYLIGELILEIEEGQGHDMDGAVMCHFPVIETKRLRSFICEDETLYGIVMIQFQMKILEQLFLFCAAQYASKLIIYADDALADEFEIYREFLSDFVSQDGEQAELIIPSDPQTYDDWVDFMDDVTLKFRQTLWQDQRINPRVKQYLKIYPL